MVCFSKLAAYAPINILNSVIWTSYFTLRNPMVYLAETWNYLENYFDTTLGIPVSLTKGGVIEDRDNSAVPWRSSVSIYCTVTINSDLSDIWSVFFDLSHHGKCSKDD